MFTQTRKCPIYYFMQTTNFKKISDRYSDQVGSKTKAIAEIAKKLGCSRSKAKKIRAGVYPHNIGLLDTKALARLFKCKESDLK